ncbi:MAG TPA: FimV/HubP family polar landmark protein, partial [Ideonella sp.]|nr:FimV/HubP family polar landmark protein [Ideonella sp.]
PAAPPAPKPAAAPKPAPAPAAAASSADNYRVRRGDSLSAIALANARSGVSLDQMLVSLYRGNPQAFVDNNMNRLKAGVVLELPGDDAGSIAPAEARQLIQAHSADFAAFKQRLAGAAPSIRANEPARQATGKVQTAVQDKKADAAPATPDKLELSRGAVKPEAQISKETERKAAETRVAELSRNVEELKRLSSSAAAPAAAPTPSVAASLPGVTLPVTPPVVASVPASAAIEVAVAASQPASVAVVVAAPVAASAASRPASAPLRPASGPVSVPPSGSFIESLADNPYVWPAAAALVALLAGLGLMALRRRSQEAGSETSFLESKQPDSFFGASGGQHVDTREAGAATGSSSLSYSLSQLDAIGDVDPVAEADVYLAYGRDLQAEEILKEALRSDPGRLPIRTKLLEVYAKRADLKGFEAQARQLHELTGGEGEDWAKAQELGLQLDPANPLYALPAHVSEVDIDTSSEPPPDLRAELPIEKTQPFDQPATRDGPATSYDLDIDLDSPSQLTGLEMTEPVRPESMLPDLELPDLSNDAPRSAKAPAGAVVDDLLDLGELDDEPPRRDPPVSGPVDFDFGDLSLDLETPPAAAPAPAPAAASAAAAATAPTAAPAAAPAPAPAPAAAAIDEDDPLARKIELADEFRRIGDLEGARDLLDEVLAKATGGLRARAEAMLKDLG